VRPLLATLLYGLGVIFQLLALCGKQACGSYVMRSRGLEELFMINTNVIKRAYIKVCITYAERYVPGRIPCELRSESWIHVYEPSSIVNAQQEYSLCIICGLTVIPFGTQVAV
jgi:hypothetical protein